MRAMTSPRSVPKTSTSRLADSQSAVGRHGSPALGSAGALPLSASLAVCGTPPHAPAGATRLALIQRRARGAPPSTRLSTRAAPTISFTRRLRTMMRSTTHASRLAQVRSQAQSGIRPQSAGSIAFTRPSWGRRQSCPVARPGQTSGCRSPS